MKKSSIVFSLLVSIIAALFSMTVNAQQRGVINWQNNGEMNAFLFDDVDSITYSRVGLDNRTYPNVVVQEVWKQDSVYRIPINTIDSVTLKGPKPVYKDNVFHIRDFHYPYVTDVTKLTVTFDVSIPSDSLPVIGQVVVSDRAYVEPFMHGFAGRVTNIVRSGNTVLIECESVTLLDIFDEFMCFGKIVTTEDSIPTRSPNRSIIDEEGDTTIYFGTKKIDLVTSGSSSISLTITPKITLDYLVHVAAFEKPIFKFIATVTNDYESPCRFGVFWDQDTAIEKEFYPDFCSLNIPIVPEIGLNAFISLGAYLRLDAGANLSLTLPFDTWAQFGFDSQHKDPNHKKLWLDFKQPVWRTLEGSADFNATVEAGIGLKAGLCIFSEDAVGANFTLEVGPRFSGKLGFNTNASTVYSKHYNDKITFEPLTATLSGEVLVAVPDIIEIIDEKWPIADLQIGQLFPALAPRTIYLLPDFSKPYLPSPYNAVVQGLSMTALTTNISRSLLFPVKPGLMLYKNNTPVDTIYSVNDTTYKISSDWKKKNLQMELNNGDYEPGTYTAKPFFKIFNRFTVPVDSIATVTIPEPLSDLPSTVSLKIDETKTINFTGGWGMYVIDNKDTTICKATYTASSIKIKGRKEGNTTLDFWDVRTQDKRTINVLVANANPPTIFLTPNDTINFGKVLVDSTKTEKLRVTGTNLTGPLTVSSSNQTRYLVNGKSSITLNPNNNGTVDEKVTVSYTPNAVGVNGGWIHVSGGGADKKSVYLYGRGVQAKITLTPNDTINFGNVPVNSTKTATLKVKGTNLSGPLTVSSSNYSRYLVNGKRSITLNPNNNGTVDKEVTVSYTPDAASGNGGWIHVSGGGADKKSVYLHGRGVQAKITLTPNDTIYFGDVPVNSTKTMTLNVKGSNLTGPLTVSCTNNTRYLVNDKSKITLSPNNNGTVNEDVTVYYTPDEVTKNGNKAKLYVRGGGIQPDTIILKGRGILPITADPDSLVFGTVVKGYSAERTITVTGNGLTGNINVISTKNVFKVSTNNLPARGGVLTVRYKPDKAEDSNGEIILSSGAAELRIPVSGTCEDAYINVSPDTLDFKTLSPGMSRTKYFTVSTNVPGTLTSGPFVEDDEYTVPLNIYPGKNSVTFKSDYAGTFSKSIRIQDNTSGAYVRLPMVANVVSTITAESVSFTARNYDQVQYLNVQCVGANDDLVLTKSGDTNLFIGIPSTISKEDARQGVSIPIYCKPNIINVDSASVEVLISGGDHANSKTVYVKYQNTY